jgi:hypothetical protein
LDIDKIKDNINNFFEVNIEEPRPFIFMLITVFFVIAVFSTILMYMNFFLLENPKLEKRIHKGVNQEIKKIKKNI